MFVISGFDSITDSEISQILGGFSSLCCSLPFGSVLLCSVQSRSEVRAARLNGAPRLRNDADVACLASFFFSLNGGTFLSKHYVTPAAGGLCLKTCSLLENGEHW